MDIYSPNSQTMIKKSGALIVFCVVFTTMANASVNRDTVRQAIPIQISILDESVSYPNFWFTRYSYNPAVMIGTEWELKSGKKHDWHLAGNIGFYHHEDWQSAFFLLPELGYRKRFNRVGLSARLGAGYVFGFHPRPVYGATEGGFGEVKNSGYLKLMTSLSLNLGYKLKDALYAPEVYLTFMESVEFPLNEWASVHHFVGAGYRFYLKK